MNKEKEDYFKNYMANKKRCRIIHKNLPKCRNAAEIYFNIITYKEQSKKIRNDIEFELGEGLW